MPSKSKYGVKKNIANLFGGFGYLSLSLQWVWVIILQISFIKGLVVLVAPGIDTTPPPPSPAVEPSVSTSGGSPEALVVLGVIVTIAIIILSVYILTKIPSTVVKTSHKVVQETAEHVAPAILRVQHVESTPVKVKGLTFKLVIIIKSLLIVVGAALPLTSQFAAEPVVEFSAAVYVGLALASATIFFFGMQYILVRVLSVKRQDIL